ncbi:Hypothetical protein FKW44_000037 [Caligus rogercresseyi]|uniref:Uncharacterized protein n=1 Tax=Caligus rogercresseyi TaxID=217165 RepID=A0A7T8QUK7_CALRO|nr:Hypothetical protein FKW44_000037 [Caligus rogercresseyi]
MKLLWKESLDVYHSQHAFSRGSYDEVSGVLKILLSKVDEASIAQTFYLNGLCPLDLNKIDFSKYGTRAPEKVKLPHFNRMKAFANPSGPDYEIARNVIMKLLPKKKLELAMRNEGERGLADLWSKINAKIKMEGPSTSEDFYSIMDGHNTEEVVVSIDADTLTTNMEDATEEPKFTYVVLNNY